MLGAAILDNRFLIRKYAHLDKAGSLTDTDAVETVIPVVERKQTYELGFEI